MKKYILRHDKSANGMMCINESGDLDYTDEETIQSSEQCSTVQAIYG